MLSLAGYEVVVLGVFVLDGAGLNSFLTLLGVRLVRLSSASLDATQSHLQIQFIASLI